MDYKHITTQFYILADRFFICKGCFRQRNFFIRLDQKHWTFKQIAQIYPTYAQVFNRCYAYSTRKHKSKIYLHETIKVKKL